MKQTISITDIPSLSIGTWAFSGAELWGGFEKKEAIRVIHQALDYGLCLFDTAERYGNGVAEQVLGEALRDRRDQALVATKVYTEFLNYDGVIQSCEESLKRLDTDYLDLFQIHWPSYEIPLDETLAAFVALQQQGKIRAYSVCNFGTQTIADLQTAADKVRRDVNNQGGDIGAIRLNPLLNQLPYSLIWRLAEVYFPQAGDEFAPPVWAYSPLGQGLLTGKYETLEDVPLNRRGTRFYDHAWSTGVRFTSSGYEQEIFRFLGQLKALSEQTGHSCTALSFAFVKANPAVASTLVGARSLEQLKQNLSAFQTEVAQDVLTELERLSRELLLEMGQNADPWEGGHISGGRFR